MTNKMICRCAALTWLLFATLPSSGQETLTVTRESGTTIEIGQNTLFDMVTGEGDTETYVLTPATPAEQASVTIIEMGTAEAGSETEITKATGKKITIWLQPGEQEGQERMDFLIEGEARVVQGSNRMYGPKSIEFKDLLLTIEALDEKEGEMQYTFSDGRNMDWQGQGLQLRFEADQTGEYTRYVVKGFKTLGKSTRLVFFHPRLKGGIGHLMPLGQSAGAGSAESGRKVSPSR